MLRSLSHGMAWCRSWCCTGARDVSMAMLFGLCSTAPYQVRVHDAGMMQVAEAGAAARCSTDACAGECHGGAAKGLQGKATRCRMLLILPCLRNNSLC